MNAHGSKIGILSSTLGALALGVAFACAGSGSALATAKLSDRQSGYHLEVLVGGVPARTFQHDGETYVMGSRGQEYTLRIHNRSGRRVEAVASIDGLDVVDGKPASYDKRGYLIPAWGSVDIDGWRLSAHEAATFRFSSVPASYAASQGKARNVGVIGVAIFPERMVRPRPQSLYRPAPHPEPYSWDGVRGGLGNAADEAGPARKSSAPAESYASGSPEPDAPAPPPVAKAEAEARAAEAYRRDDAPRGRAREHSFRPGLGTEFGAAIDSRVHEVAFQRESAREPAAILGARYNDRDGLIAMGVPIYPPRYTYSDAELRQSASPFPVSARQYAAPPRDWNGR